MKDEIAKCIEYIGPKEQKKFYSSYGSEVIVFKANADFDGRKVAVVSVSAAEDLLRFPNVFREVKPVAKIDSSSLFGETKPEPFERTVDLQRKAKGKNK